MRWVLLSMMKWPSVFPSADGQQRRPACIRRMRHKRAHRHSLPIGRCVPCVCGLLDAFTLLQKHQQIREIMHSRRDPSCHTIDHSGFSGGSSRFFRCFLRFGAEWRARGRLRILFVFSAPLALALQIPLDGSGESDESPIFIICSRGLGSGEYRDGRSSLVSYYYVPFYVPELPQAAVIFMQPFASIIKRQRRATISAWGVAPGTHATTFLRAESPNHLSAL